MRETKVVILAAGRSSRLYPRTLDCPKSLLPFGNEPLLVRTVRQLQQIDLCDIQIVVGHLSDQIKTALRDITGITYIHNDNYATDMNSLSLHLGLNTITHSALVLEADVAFADECWQTIANAIQNPQSIWFTRGKFQTHQIGGIIQSNETQRITDMKIVKSFDEKYANYNKNLGLVYIGPNELPRYQMILNNALQQSNASYYMSHWIENLTDLPCNEINLYPHPACSFNTEEELKYCRDLISASGVIS